MQMRSNTSLPLLAAVAAVLTAGPAFAATYQLSTAVALPFTSVDGSAAAISTTYTTLNLASVSRATLPNGTYGPLILGTVTGTTNTATSVAVNTAYAYDPANGFRLIGLYTPTSAGGHINTAVKGFNGVGQVIGQSSINSNSSNTNGILGTEAWLYSTTGNTSVPLGLTGANFSYTITTPVSGTYHSSSPGFINDAGVVVGTTNRYAGDSTSPSTGLGMSAWIYTGGTTSEIGLTGSNYSYAATTGTTTARYSSNSVLGLTQTGIVMGSANAYYDRGTGAATGLGTDGWVSVGGATPTAIGLYARGTDPVVNGFSGFKYYTAPTGTTGTTPDTSRSRTTTLVALNASGQVAGYSAFYNPANMIPFLGYDAFVYSTTAGTYRQLGFTTNGFTSSTPAAGSSSFVSVAGARDSRPVYMNAAGQIVGTSSQYFFYNNNGTPAPATGQAAWIDSGSGPTRIGLFGQAADANAGRHVNPQTGVTSSTLTNLTESGFVGGYSNRYYLSGTGVGTTLGQDAWVFDSTTGTTYTVDPVNAAGGNFTSSTIAYLSELGVAVGQYAVSTSTSSSTSFKAFLWSVDGGFVDLGTSLSSNLSTTDYQNLIMAFYSSPDGSTLYSTAASKTASSTTVGGLVVLAVPEPASLALLSVGGVALLRRRSRGV